MFSTDIGRLRSVHDDQTQLRCRSKRQKDHCYERGTKEHSDTSPVGWAVVKQTANHNAHDDHLHTTGLMVLC